MDLREDGKGNFCQRKLLMIYNPQPEYLIARSQLTLGSVGIRSHSIFYAILDNYIYVYGGCAFNQPVCFETCLTSLGSLHCFFFVFLRGSHGPTLCSCIDAPDACQGVGNKNADLTHILRRYNRQYDYVYIYMSCMCFECTDGCLY